MASTAEKAADAALHDMAEQIAALKTDIAGLTEAMTEYGRAQGRAIGENITEKATAGAAKAHAAGTAQAERLNAQAHALQVQANDFILRQPATALGIAAGLGFLVGLLSSRK